MFHVELTPLGGILGPLKSDLGVFWAKIPLYPYNVNIARIANAVQVTICLLVFTSVY